jgi:CRP-like cAMP-binding protein
MTEERIARLRACPLFQDLSLAALSDLALVCERRTAHAGAVVIAEGSEGDEMYVLTAGRVRVEKRTLYQDAYTVAFLDGGAGAFFGEVALLDRERRSASVIAESDCELLAIGRERFLEFGDRHAQAGLLATRRIAQYLAGRLRSATQDVATLFSALVEELEQRL